MQLSMLNLTLADIAMGLDNEHFTSVDLVRSYLARINEVDGIFKSVIEINPDAIAFASQLDEERKISGRRGPLHGVPILLKDNIFTFDAMETSSGSYALLGIRPKREGGVIRKLREVGAILLGKTNLSEFCNLRGKASNSGWSPRGGQCEGAYFPKMSPSGSSSGSAVATDLALGFASIGSETIGSMISPAESNNIAAIKPTAGLVSQDGVIPVSRKHDSLGPMARTIKDAAAILAAIAGKDLHDPRTARIPFSHVPDYTESCKATDLNSVRIGVPWNTMADIPSAIMETFKTALAQLKSSGATIIDTEYTGADQHAALSTKEKLTSQLTNFRQSMDDFLQELERNPNKIYSVEDLSNVVIKDPREDYPYRDIELWKWAIDLDEDADDAKLASERDAFFAGEGGILGALERSNLDALVFPTAAKMSDHFAAGGGLPVITVPLGYLPNDTEVKWSPRHDLVTQSPNRPYGIGITGKAFSESTLIRIASVHERLSPVREQAQHYKLPSIDFKGRELKGSL